MYNDAKEILDLINERLREKDDDRYVYRLEVQMMIFMYYDLLIFSAEAMSTRALVDLELCEIFLEVISEIKEKTATKGDKKMV